MLVLKKEVAVPLDPSSSFMRFVPAIAALITFALGALAGYTTGYGDGHYAAGVVAHESVSRPVYMAPPPSPEPEIRTTVMENVSGYDIRLKRGGKLIDRWTFDSWNNLPVTIVHRSPCFADETRDCLAIGRHGKTFRYEMLERREMVNYTFAPITQKPITSENAKPTNKAFKSEPF